MDFSEFNFWLYVEVFGDFDEEMSGNKVLVQAVEQEDHGHRHGQGGEEGGGRGGGQARQLRLRQELNLITESLPPLIIKN